MERCNCGALDCKYCHPELDYHEDCRVCGNTTHGSCLDEENICLDCRETMKKCDSCGTYFDPENIFCPECEKVKAEKQCSCNVKFSFRDLLAFERNNSFTVMINSLCAFSDKIDYSAMNAFERAFDSLEKQIRDFDKETALEDLSYFRKSIIKMIQSRGQHD
jgi:hypothetical protein